MLKLHARLLRQVACYLLFFVPAVGFCANSITISEKAGVTTANYPIQIGRPFVQGEIAGYPQAIVDGTPVATQADVKSRWPDGTVRHAILTFLLPKLTAKGSVVVTFANQSSGNNTGSLDQAGMLDAGFDFDATMELTNGSTQRASARAMLSAGAFSYWLQGPVATSIILADHSSARAFDLGFDANRSFRPIFHATFWPAIKKIRVRFIGEIANSQVLQDMSYALALKTGYASPAQVYSKAKFTQAATTRWTKEFWIGGAPSEIAIDHNLAYLTKTTLMPNYAMNKSVAGATVDSSYAEWTKAAKDIGDGGLWMKDMSGTGGRPDLGPYTGWVTWWLYNMNTGDTRMRDIAFGQGDLAASWPSHIREGSAGRLMTKAASAGCTFACGSPALGHVVSIVARPTFTYLGPTTFVDGAKAVGPFSAGLSSTGWHADTAHLPDNWTPLYLLTGDFWYLEESWFWGSFSTAMTNANGAWYGRPADGTAVLYPGQIRATAWDLRTRVHVASISPDNTPEKSYFETAVRDGLAVAEGMHNIAGTSLYKTKGWNFGYTVMRAQPTEGYGKVINESPLHFWWQGGSPSVDPGTFLFTPGEGTVSTTGSSRTIVFSSMAACQKLDAGQTLMLGTTQRNIITLSCPRATLNANIDLSHGSTWTSTTVAEASSSWEQSILMWALGRAKELGYPADALISWHSAFFTGQLASPSYNPYLIAEYRIAAVNSKTGTWYTSWQDVQKEYLPAKQTTQTFMGSLYTQIATAATSMITDEPGGASAWLFMKSRSLDVDPHWNLDPTWAILPRSTASLPAISSCDLNMDGHVDSVDYQMAVSNLLNSSNCTYGDLNQNGKCDVVDVQRIVNTALGATCRIGK